MPEDEDGKLRWCSNHTCLNYTPHKAVKVEDRVSYRCEFCDSQETVQFGKRVFDLPVFEKN
jgi:aspartate carbamoyltransferase regulatory subunit